MMDIPAAVRWLDESAELMVTLRATLESHCKDEPDLMKREFIAASREFVDVTLKGSILAATAIMEQMTSELLLLMGHSQDLSALRKAENRYVAEQNKTLLIFKQSTPTYPRPEKSAAGDGKEARISELNAKFPLTPATNGRAP